MFAKETFRRYMVRYTRSFPSLSASRMATSGPEVPSRKPRLSGRAEGGIAGSIVSYSEKPEKNVEQQVYKGIDEPGFHGSKMISHVDHYDQLLVQNDQLLGANGFGVIASCVDHDYRQTYPRGACPTWLGTRRVVQAITRSTRYCPAHGEFRRACERANGNARQNRGRP